MTIIPHRIYTAGYRSHSLDDLATTAKRLDAFVADIRFSTQSPNPLWRGATLAKRLPERYLHVPELGNINYRTGGEILLQDARRGIHCLLDLSLQRPVIALCACLDFERCHRSEVARLLDERGVATSELVWVSAREVAA